MPSLVWRRAFTLAAILVLIAAALAVVRPLSSAVDEPLERALPRAAAEFLGEAGEAGEAGEVEKDYLEGSQGQIGGVGGEAAEQMTAMAQWAEARTAPGIVNPGAYGAAFSHLTALARAGGTWSSVTRVPYDADDPVFRDYWANSSGGSGLVTGRITGLAADADGYVYAAGADGGVWRSSTGGGDWTPIADDLPSLSGGDLQLGPDGSLWYATGEANTGGTSFVGSGVYRLASPRTGSFSIADRVGGSELESTTINALRFDGAGRVWAATLRGVWSHGTASTAGSWTLAYAPNPQFLPASLAAFSTTQTGFGTGNTDSTTNAAYKNIVNDVAVDPRDPRHLIAAIGWRNGDVYNGFYESRDRGVRWVKVNPTGAINPKEIGNVTFAWSSDRSRLYAINQSTTLLNKATGTVNSYLDGIYLSNGSVAGPWTKVADQRKLASSGSAMKQSVTGRGWGPGIQSWYNQFLVVDPANPSHVYAGLEEVFETKDAGATWTTVGPYWNFYFSCWAPDSVYPPNGAPNRCPLTTHPDQHSAAVGTYNGKTYVFVGNDGGVYRRPINGRVNRNGNATDWESLNDGTIDALQYYAVGVGAMPAGATASLAPSGSGAIVSGGLQDNGGSIVRAAGAGRKMSSNFGGDGGDVLVDPANGCNIVGEYVYLTMYVTQTCANPGGNPRAFYDPSQATTYTIAPPEVNARFIAPFTADRSNVNRWLAGGNSLWFNAKGFAIRSGSEWKKVYQFSSDYLKVATAIGYNKGWAVAAWCGPTCNNRGFGRGVVVGHLDGTTWTWTASDLAASGVPNRYIGGAAVADDGTMYLVVGGFSRRFTEGPGAGIGHVFKSTDHGVTWVSIDGSGANAFPDVPANTIAVTANGIVVGTDLGIVYRADGSNAWQRLGSSFPTTVVTDVEVGPDGFLYAATHGRGIWRLPASGL